MTLTREREVRLHTGMLWYDNSPNATLTARIQRAIDYYRSKYHRDPNLCLVPLDVVGAEPGQLGKVTVRGYKPILPGHLWIGVEELK